MKNQSEISDQDLCRLISAGREDAFKELFNRYFNSLFHFAFRRIHDESTVRDLLQDTFLKVWIARADLDPNRSIKSYLFTITNNLIIDHFRKTSNHFLDYEDFSDSVSFTTHSLEQIPSTDLTDKIREIINKQPDSIKTIFFLSKQEGYKNQEIAEILGISVKTVEARMTKLIKIIRENLTKGFS